MSATSIEEPQTQSSDSSDASWITSSDSDTDVERVEEAEEFAGFRDERLDLVQDLHRDLGLEQLRERALRLRLRQSERVRERERQFVRQTERLRTVQAVQLGHVQRHLARARDLNDSSTPCLPFTAADRRLERRRALGSGNCQAAQCLLYCSCDAPEVQRSSLKPSARVLTPRHLASTGACRAGSHHLGDASENWRRTAPHSRRGAVGAQLCLPPGPPIPARRASPNVVRSALPSGTLPGLRTLPGLHGVSEACRRPPASIRR
jgi:hypothetical protein